MPYQLEFPDYSKPFKNFFDRVYTVVLMLSDGNHGLDYYPETASEYQDNRDAELSNNPVCASHRNLVGDVCPDPKCKLKKYETIEYKQGTLVLTNSRVLHRATTENLKDRIIVRGYAVSKNDTLYLYW